MLKLSCRVFGSKAQLSSLGHPQGHPSSQPVTCRKLPDTVIGVLLLSCAS